MMARCVKAEMTLAKSRKKSLVQGQNTAYNSVRNTKTGGNLYERCFAGYEGASANKGTLMLNATCALQNIAFPQDINFLNEARQCL